MRKGGLQIIANALDPQTIFTIGHSNHDLETFLGLLKQNGIEVVVDIRSNPYSRFASHFNKADLHNTLRNNSIKYLFLGKELGGRPSNRKFYNAKGHVVYSRLAESPAFHEGIEKLIKEIKQYRVALMCSEENPRKCHRYLLVGKVLEKGGVEIIHIRGEGQLQSQDELSREDETGQRQEMFKFE